MKGLEIFLTLFLSVTIATRSFPKSVGENPRRDFSLTRAFDGRVD